MNDHAISGTSMVVAPPCTSIQQGPEINKRVLEEQHPDLLESMANLSRMYRKSWAVGEGEAAGDADSGDELRGSSGRTIPKFPRTIFFISGDMGCPTCSESPRKEVESSHPT